MWKIEVSLEFFDKVRFLNLTDRSWKERPTGRRPPCPPLASEALGGVQEREARWHREVRAEQLPSYLALIFAVLEWHTQGTKNWGCTRGLAEACPQGLPSRTGAARPSRGWMPFLLGQEVRPCLAEQTRGLSGRISRGDGLLWTQRAEAPYTRNRSIRQLWTILNNGWGAGRLKLASVILYFPKGRENEFWKSQVESYEPIPEKLYFYC